MFAIQQKYDFSSKSQPFTKAIPTQPSCLQYSKSTIFQANHNYFSAKTSVQFVVCNTAKVRFFKQITTIIIVICIYTMLFAIQQKYDFSSKSQLSQLTLLQDCSCLQYSKSTIFQANHNAVCVWQLWFTVVCNTAKVRFFKQITTNSFVNLWENALFAIQQKYDFSSKSQLLASFQS